MISGCHHATLPDPQGPRRRVGRGPARRRVRDDLAGRARRAEGEGRGGRLGPAPTPSRPSELAETLEVARGRPLARDRRPRAEGGRAGAGLQGGAPRPRAGDGPGRQAAGRRRRGPADQALARRLRGRRRGRRDPGPGPGRPGGRPGRRRPARRARSSPTSASPRREAGPGPGARTARPRPPRRPPAPGPWARRSCSQWREAASRPQGVARRRPAGAAAAESSRPAGRLPLPDRAADPGRRVGRPRRGVSPNSPPSGVRLHAEQLSARDPGRVRQPGRDRQRHLCRHVELVRQSLPDRHADAPGPGRLDHLLDREPDVPPPDRHARRGRRRRPTPRSPWSTPARS